MVMIYFKIKDKREEENICAAKHKKNNLILGLGNV